ncbi:DNA helicase B [Scomber scombrus]|uniref:DNA helicase B n=1 Tax=Scomber scombrus TaxID=13677 RepID=UPI002DD8232F|nr:DNA helicase B [Scomber scombrus]
MASNMFVTNKQKKTDLMKLKGYILPENKTSRDETEESDEENEAEQQPEFLDLTEINNVASGGHSFHSSVPLHKVDFQDFRTKKVYCVEGRFALRSPWWEVNCCVRVHRDKRVMKGYPSYKLRSDLDRQEWIPILSLFLNACEVQPEFISQFFKWLPPNRNVTFYNLEEVVEEFSEGNEAQAQNITSRLSCSVAGMQVHAACLYPGVMKYIQTLLPSQFIELLGQGKQKRTLPATQAAPTAQQHDDNREEEVDTSLLAKLELIIADDVWKLGFKELVYRELKLVRCEASLEAFKECNLLQTIPPLQHDALLVYDHLKKTCRKTGSTYMDKDALCQHLRNTARRSDEQAWSAIHFLREQDIVVLVKGKIALMDFHLYETGIAECLSSLVDHGPWNIPVNATEVLHTAAEDRQQKKMQTSENATTSSVEDRPSVVEPTNISSKSSESSEQQAEANPDISPIKLDPDHVRAVEMICTNPVTIISGKAGCGKTTVVSSLFKAAVPQISCEQQKIHEAYEDYKNDTGMSFESEDPEERPDIKSKEEILLTAPTGRAASLLKKKTCFPAYTLHQVLYSFMRRQKDEQGDDKQWRFKDVRIFVVDEGSMVCVQLFHTVLKLLVTHAQLRKVIILGDVRQLPSIQPGNILHDLYNSLKPVQWAIEMRTNHRTESQLIVDNAGLIADMGMRHKYGPLQFDAIVDLDGSHNTLSADKKFVLILLPKEEADDELQTAVKFLINTAPGLNDHSTSQFIAFKRNDVALINELCCTHYNKHTTKNHKHKLQFQPGDKVCCTKNGYITDAEDMKRLNQSDMVSNTQSSQKETEKMSHRLCNGEIFFIREDKTEVDNHRRSKRYLTLDDGDGRQLTVEYRELQRECRLQHAWAGTIHTFQGSENETIVYVVGDSIAQTWKHIYTAITRGQTRVYVVARESVMESAIQRRETSRNTRLASLVKNQLVQPLMQLNTPQGIPSGCSPQKSTPLHTQAPNRPSSSDGQFTPPWPKRTDDRVKGDTAPSGLVNNNVCSSSPRSRSSDLSGVEQLNSTVTSQGNKRTLTAESQEVPCKQPRVTESTE